MNVKGVLAIIELIAVSSRLFVTKVERMMWIILLTVVGAFSGALAETNICWTLNNLAPCTSSRVLLMNNDTNDKCPIGWFSDGVCISGQGYDNTNEATTVVGGTFWWHDDAAKPTSAANTQLNLLPGMNHVLYQKTDDAGGKKALWTLVECRAGSGGYNSTTGNNGNRNYLPWSDTCQPIDPTKESAPIPATWSSGASKLGGIKQVAHISLRCTTDAGVYSPFYEEGLGEIYFDVVNGWTQTRADSICVEISTKVKDGRANVAFGDGLDWGDYDWGEPVPCDMFVVENKSDINLPDENHDIRILTPVSTASQHRDNMYFRVRVRSENPRVPMRFRIRRLTSNATTTNPDFNGLIFIDNIIASYPDVPVEPSHYIKPETVGANTWRYRTDGETAEIYNKFSAAVSPELIGDVTIPSMLGGVPVTRIGSAALLGCSGLKSVTIPENVTSIGDYAFYGCSGLETLTIPSSVTNIGNYALSGCSNLMSIIVADGNSEYMSINGLLLSKDCRTVMFGVNGRVTIPDSVTRIKSDAFRGCSGLQTVTIPDSVTNIGELAFYQCSGLTNVLFMGDAPSLGLYSFFDVSAQCSVSVCRGTSGWGVEIPGSWQGLPTDYFQHRITFDANGGTVETEAMTIEHSATIGELPVPTREKAVFLGWFTETEGGDEVDAPLTVTNGITLYAHWLTEVAAPVIATTGGSTVFRMDSCEVEITCATEGAVIYYTDDGTTPRRIDEYLYTTPITISESTTFKAVAVVGELRSGYVLVTITKNPLTIEEALDGGEGVAFSTSATFPWLPVIDSSAKVGDASVRSGAIGNKANTWFSASVSGTGVMSFWCKTSCEHDLDGTFSWDKLMVYTNDVEISEWRMDGETDWTKRTLSFAGGENTVKWAYYKDKSDAEGEDCVWVDGVVWSPYEAVSVGGSIVTVPMAWIAEHPAIVSAAGGDAAGALRRTAANGRMSVAECYVVGVDPEKEEEDFKITSIPMKADGTVDIEHIVFNPPQERWNVSGARPVLKGAANLSDVHWPEVTERNKGAVRFFKVEVELP